MNKLTPLFFLCLSLIACTGQPYEESDPKSIEDLLKARKENGTNFSTTIGKPKEQGSGQTAPTAGPTINYQTTTPLIRKEGVLSFEEWKKAKEANSKEYQDYLEYREYLQTLQSQ